jgi:hypothetical protein
MQSEINDLQNRYDDLLLIENKSASDWNEIAAIEARVQQIVFPTPRREDFDDQEWEAFWAERHAYEDAHPDCRLPTYFLT